MIVVINSIMARRVVSGCSTAERSSKYLASYGACASSTVVKQVIGGCPLIHPNKRDLLGRCQAMRDKDKYYFA